MNRLLLIGIVVESILLALIVDVSLGSRDDRKMYRHFKDLERAGRRRWRKDAWH